LAIRIINTKFINKNDMIFRLGDSSIVEKMSINQLKDYWHELKMLRYDSHFYLRMLEKIKLLNPNLVLPEEEEIEKIKSEALSLAMWEENWENKNRDRIKNGGIDYSLFLHDKKIIELKDNTGLSVNLNR
jgi:hypothetical protein